MASKWKGGENDMKDFYLIGLIVLGAVGIYMDLQREKSLIKQLFS
jgi:hypothetical protein